MATWSMETWKKESVDSAPRPRIFGPSGLRSGANRVVLDVAYRLTLDFAVAVDTPRTGYER